MIDIDHLRVLFIKYLTLDSETHDARSKEFNQAIFDAEEGFARWTNTDLDMVLDKFDRAVKEYKENKGVQENR